MRPNHLIEQRLALERGTIFRSAARGIALVYPSPYAIGMASLGFQTLYRMLNDLPDTAAERAFLPEGDGQLLTYERLRPVGDFEVVAISVASELELSGLFRCFEAMGVSPLASERDKRSDPLIILGGPLTYSNPAPLTPFGDVIVVGEVEPVLSRLVDAIFEDLGALDGLDGVCHAGGPLPAPLVAASSCLPAYSAVTTPDSALPDMFLVEAERGCSRGCTFCATRRHPDGGMRVIPPEAVLGVIPQTARRVGLVGAAVSDHPQIEQIVERVVDSGREVGLSSLRADRLTPTLVSLLARGGMRTLTVAADGASQRLRDALDKQIKRHHLHAAAELASAYELPQLKLYVMVGLPDEVDEDLQDLVELIFELDARFGRKLIVTVSPFVPKKNTPLRDAPFVGHQEATRRINTIRGAFRKGRVEIKPASGRWAYVEYEIARGGAEAGLAALAAHRAGGSFSAYRAAFAK